MFSIRKRFVTHLIIAAKVVAALELAAQPVPDLKTAPPHAPARQLPDSIRTDYYEVRGTNAEALLASMKARQPSSTHASTEWRIDWDYEWQQKPDECILRSFTTRVRVRYTFPQWVDWQRADRRSRENGNATSALWRFTRVDMLATVLPPRKKWFGL
jgi:predicted secreted Zn-dependent protease